MRNVKIIILVMGLVLAGSTADVWARDEADYIEDAEGWPDITYDKITDLLLSADGRFLYAASYEDRAVALFSRDPSTGRLTYVEKTDAGAMDTARIVLSPDQRFVYVTSSYYGRIMVLPRDPVTGHLDRETQMLSSLWDPRALAISPDGNTVYAGGAHHAVPDETLDRVHAITAYARNAENGQLTEIADYLDDRDGNDGLQQPSAIVVSPDGATVYTVSLGDRGIGVYARDPGTGLLTFLALTTDGFAAPEFSGGPGHAAISPDGRHLYVTAAGRLALFDRDQQSGLLSLHSLYTDDDPLFEPLQNADGVTVTPDGSVVYVDGAGLLQLVRDPLSGELTSTYSTEPDCSPTFQHAVISPDGAYIYASDPSGRPWHLGATATVVTLRINDPLAPPLCGASPRTACATATRARLDLRDDAVPSRRQLRWDWRARGVGSPLGTSGRALSRQALCVYLDNGSASLVLPAEVHVGYGCESRWRERDSTISYRSGDGRNRPDGLAFIKLAALSNGDAKIQVRGDGALLAMPRLALPGQGRVLAQLVSGDGRCWESAFSAPTRNDQGRYRAKFP